MQIYHYHPETCEYVGTSMADASPLEPGVYLIPAHSTQAPPPSPVAGMVRKWAGGAWTLVAAEQDVARDPDYVPSLDDTKSAKQAEIREAADNFLAAMAAEYGAFEKLTWDKQALEADALIADPEAPAPLVRAIASARGMTPLDMAQRIAANRAQWVALSGSVVGKRLAYQDALDAAQTVEEVAAIKPVFP